MRARQALVAVVLGALLLGVAIAHMKSGVIVDYDELWHLTTGRVIVETRSVPDRDPFTFTAGDTPWVNTNWLAQVILFELYRKGGWQLDALLGVALLFAALSLVVVRARRRGASAWATLLMLFVALRALGTGSPIRPQSWTFFLLALVLVLVDRVRESPTLARGALIVATLALSAQLHGGFVFVFGAVGLSFVGELCDLARRAPDTRPKVALVLGGALVGATVVGFAIHPHGLSALVHPLRYAVDPRIAAVFAETVELQPPTLGTISGELSGGLILLLLATGLVARARWETSDLLLVLAFGHLALSTSRGIHYFSIVAVAPVALGLTAALERLRSEAHGVVERVVMATFALEPGARAFTRAVPFVFAASIALVVAKHPESLTPGEVGTPASAARIGVDLYTDVADVASYVLAHPDAGNLWNEMETGGALEWCLWPRRRVAFDGRGELHALAGTWPRQAVVRGAKRDWESILIEWRCELALARRDSSIEDALRRAGWSPVHENASLVLFARPAAGNGANR